MSPRDLEATARERVAAAGFRPLEPWPGTTRTPWHLECTTCGRKYRRFSIPSTLTPCTHPELRRLAALKAQIEAKAAKEAEREKQEDLKWLQQHMTYRAGRKNLAPMEDYPGTEPQQEGVLWWVYCKYCRRTWHMPADRIRTCPHKGTGDPTDLPFPMTAHEAKLAASRRSMKKNREANQ